jgi:penicillin amidase
VSSARAAGGGPILANDPHLWSEYPAIWYVAHLRSEDGLHVAGLTLAGAPGVFIGHNGRVAWGITMQQADDTDLFLEDLDADRMTTREPGGGAAPVAIRHETIRVRGSEPVEEIVMETARGTLSVAEEGALAWSRSWAPDTARHSLSAFLGFDRAGDGAELAEAAARYGGPPINIVWADRGGGIGIRTAGSVPIRSRGSGRFPAPAWTGDYRWLGVVPAERLPSIQDPPEGFVASGNDDWSESGAALPYPGHWASPLRVRRLREVLASRERATLDDCRSLQNDLMSLYALRVCRSLADLRDRGGDAARAVAVLSEWDGTVGTRGPAALLYPFLAEARRAAFEARESRAGAALPVGWAALASLIDDPRFERLWDDPETEAVETRDAILARALADALRSVEKEDGTDPSRWNWGRRHELTIRHPFAARFPVLGALLDPAPVEMPGEWHNPRVAGFGLDRPSADVRHIASARLLVDLGDPDRSRVVLPLGQSAHVGDVHRLDHLPRWWEGRDFPLPFSREAVAGAEVTTLRLVP